MPHRIDGDWKDFRDVFSGRIRKELKRLINNGSITKRRGKNGKISITVPKIDIPHLVYGNNGNGLGRGEGKPGDVIGKDDDGKGKGNKPGEGHQDGIEIAIDQEEILKFLQDQLKLPDLKPKPNRTFEEVRIRYNDLSLQGPESLRHNRKTMQQAMKRLAAAGELDKLHQLPGMIQPVKLITPHNSDRRYRQYREIKVPASNAAIFFARDGSGSMDAYKCDIVSDMAWWIDIWIRRFYKRTERVYIWHDTIAQETDEKKFYKYRYGGGTYCSSAMNFIAKQMENRFPPSKWNIYVIYFSDGENWGGDNERFMKVIKEKFNPNDVNLVAITQILAWQYDGSLKHYVDTHSEGIENIRTTAITHGAPQDGPGIGVGGWGWHPSARLTDEERSEQIMRAITDLLGANVEGDEGHGGQSAA